MLLQSLAWLSCAARPSLLNPSRESLSIAWTSLFAAAQTAVQHRRFISLTNRKLLVRHVLVQYDMIALHTQHRAN